MAELRIFSPNTLGPILNNVWQTTAAQPNHYTHDVNLHNAQGWRISSVYVRGTKHGHGRHCAVAVYCTIKTGYTELKRPKHAAGEDTIRKFIKK